MEKALEADLGNLKDSIENTVYHLQKYVNFINEIHSKKKSDMLSDPNTSMMYSFLIFEDKELLRDKMFRLAINMTRCVDRKHANIQRLLSKEKDSEIFGVCKADYATLFTTYERIMVGLEEKKYQMKKGKIFEERFDLYLNELCDWKIQHTEEVHEITYQTLLDMVEDWYQCIRTGIDTIMCDMRKDCDVINMAIDTKYIIQLMVSAYRSFGAFCYLAESSLETK